MTQDDRIERLEGRVDRIEQSIASDLKDIREKVNEMALRTAKQECPSPGACIQLSHDLTGFKSYFSKELDRTITNHNATMLRVERLELQLISLNQQKAWIMGAWAAISIVAGAIGAIATIVVSHYVGKL